MVKRIAYLIIILLLTAPTAFADTHTASSCSLTDVQTAITAASNGDTIQIPAGECEWTSGITLTSTKALTIQGAGKTSTVITRNGTAITLTESASTITGIGFVLNSGDVTIMIAGGVGWRIHNCKFTNNTGASREAIDIGSANVSSYPSGLIDNNEFIEERLAFASASNTTEARYIWSQDYQFGSADTDGDSNIYIENNTFHKTVTGGGNVLDASAFTGNYVARFNTVTGTTQFQVHSLQDANNRGARGWEIYNNSFTASPSGWTAMFIRSGSGYVFNNTVSGYSYSILLDNVRSSYAITTAGQCNGTSDWDGNTSGQSGWPCRDQIGRGKDSSLWTTENPYPAQISYPAYFWDNGASAYIHNSCETWIQASRDYYDYNASFDGTSGVGKGLKAAMPATCTKSTDANGGPAYWATDENKLYRCTDTNTWTLHYTPYTCPHPLADPSAQGSCDFTTAGITGYTLTGGESDETAPTVYQASVSTAGTSVTFTFDEPITATSGAAFTLDFGTAVTITCPAVETAASSLTCTTSRTIYQAEGNSTFDYTGTKVADEASNPLDAITNQAIQNLSTQAETPPAVALTISSHTGAVVTTTPSGISCGSTCAANFETGTTVTVSGYCLDNYSGFTITSGKDCNTETGAVAMSAAKECAAYCSKLAADNKIGTGTPGHKVGAGNPAHKRY